MYEAELVWLQKEVNHLKVEGKYWEMIEEDSRLLELGIEASRS